MDCLDYNPTSGSCKLWSMVSILHLILLMWNEHRIAMLEFNNPMLLDNLNTSHLALFIHRCSSMCLDNIFFQWRCDKTKLRFWWINVVWFCSPYTTRSWGLYCAFVVFWWLCGIVILQVLLCYCSALICPFFPNFVVELLSCSCHCSSFLRLYDIFLYFYKLILCLRFLPSVLFLG